MIGKYSIIARLEHCQRLIEELKEVAGSDKFMTAEQAASFRVAVINVERKLLEIVAEIGGEQEGEESENTQEA